MIRSEIHHRDTKPLRSTQRVWSSQRGKFTAKARRKRSLGGLFAPIVIEGSGAVRSDTLWRLVIGTSSTLFSRLHADEKRLADRFLPDHLFFPFLPISVYFAPSR